MGVVLTNKSDKEVHLGYVGFGLIRQTIARSYSETIGKIYKKMYSLRNSTEITDDEYKIIENALPKYLLEFLYHSDCDGYFDEKSVKGIYKELVKLNPVFDNYSLEQKYFELLDLFKDGERIDLY